MVTASRHNLLAVVMYIFFIVPLMNFASFPVTSFSKLNSVLVNATITAMYGWIPISSQSHQNPHHPMFLNRHPLHLTEQNSNKRWA